VGSDHIIIVVKEFRICAGLHV